MTVPSRHLLIVLLFGVLTPTVDVSVPPSSRTRSLSVGATNPHEIAGARLGSSGGVASKPLRRLPATSLLSTKETLRDRRAKRQDPTEDDAEKLADDAEKEADAALSAAAAENSGAEVVKDAATTAMSADGNDALAEGGVKMADSGVAGVEEEGAAKIGSSDGEADSKPGGASGAATPLEKAPSASPPASPGPTEIDRDTEKDAKVLESRKPRERTQEEELQRRAAERRRQQLEREDAKAQSREMRIREKRGDRSQAKDARDMETRVTQETDSGGLARMLGSIKMDLYKLNEKVKHVDEHLDEGVHLKEEDPEDMLIYPISVCLRCVIMLVAQYFVVYTAMVFCKVFVEFFVLGHDTKCEQALTAACDTVFYAPMLCVLFVATRMRALQITQGERGSQDWAQAAMILCTWALILQTLLVLAIPVFTGEPPEIDKDTGGITIHEKGSKAIAGLLTFLRYVAMAAIYVGIVVIAVAVHLMDARNLGAKSPDLWDDPSTAKTEYAPPVSAAMQATLVLSVFFFLVYLAHAVVWSCAELSAGTQVWIWECEQAFRACTLTVDLAPMFCVLFICARMRALQVDPVHGRMQRWVDHVFYVAVVAIITQTLAAGVYATAGFINARPWTESEAGSSSARTGVLGGSPHAPSPQFREDDYDGPLPPTPTQRIIRSVRYLALLVVYCCGCVVLYKITQLRAPEGQETPLLAPTTYCVLTLSVAYLLVYLLIHTLEPKNSGGMETRSGCTMAMAGNVVKFCPMLAVLFLAARLRALQLSDQKGSPQCWAQDAMYLSTAALLVQLLVLAILGFATADLEVDEMGFAVSTPRMKYIPGRMCIEFIQFAALMVLWGGAIVVVVSIITIQPDSASCAERGFTGKR